MPLASLTQGVRQLASKWRSPARFAARHHLGLAAIGETDIALLERLPWGNTLPYVVGLVAVVFGLLQVSIVDVYTESIVFLGATLVLGFLSPVLGVLLLVTFGTLDLAHHGSWSWGWPGRLVGLWLLWLLAVEVPILTRSAEATFERVATLVARRRDPGRTNPVATGIAATLVVLASVALVFTWALGVPILLRPVFTWAGRAPTDPSLDWVQRSWWTLGILSAAASALGYSVRRIFGPGSVVAPSPQGARPRGFAQRAIPAALLVVAFSGMITRVTDVAILAIALFAVGPAVRAAVRYLKVGRLAKRVPRAVRFLAAFGLTYAAAWAVSKATFGTVTWSEFFPVVLGVAIGLVIFAVLVDSEPEAAAGDDAATAVVRMVVIGASLVLAPRVALANNCASLADCFHSGAAAAATAAGAAAAGGFGGGRRRPPR